MFDRYFRAAHPVLKALPMLRFPSLVALGAVAALALLTQTSSARADGPAIVAPVVVQPNVSIATPARIALTTSALPMGTLMVVLDVLGIIEKDAPKPAATTRTATFLAPEPPNSSLVVAKF